MYRQILHEYWGYDEFRGIQEEIIESIGAGKDTLGLMPTGGGKSITFQVPALAKEGVCIVITPLIALMKDQVQSLRRRGILAAAIYSGMSHNEIVVTLENCILGNIKFLYVSPERLSTQLFKTKLSHMRVSFITVDEAHCISQWGYDFRPSYMDIAGIRKLVPDAPVLALTATATPEVIDDIQEKLGFTQKNVFRMSFERKNLTYVIRKTNDKEAELTHILNSVAGSAIVYTRSRQGTKNLAKLLNDNSLQAAYYHAGLEHAVRNQRQQQWQNNEVRIMVATNAFGMGIDKPDVRLVVHYDSPDSIEAYFQEAGRAGRDGNHSWAVLLHNGSDEMKLNRRIPDTYPEKEFIRNVYEHLAYFFQVAMGFGSSQTHTFDIQKFCTAYKMYPTRVDSSLRILQNAGYLEYNTDPDTKARVMFLLDRSSLYHLDNLTPNEDKVITALLRLYGGLFVDYQYVDEGFIAAHSGVNPNHVYHVLKALSKRHILHFIPQRKMPYITYLKDRDEAERIVISPDVYEKRRSQMEKRISSIIAYAKDDNICRSRQLLKYFGESSTTDCGRCDVCIANKGKPSEQSITNAADAIMAWLDDGKAHCIAELNNIRIPRKQLDLALDNLMQEEVLIMKGGMIKIASK